MARARRIEFIMGTAVDIHVRTSPFDGEILEDVIDSVMVRLRAIDEMFSTYNPNSEVSRFGRGELTRDDLSADVRMILDLCETLAHTTGGYFDMYAAAEQGPALEHQAGSPRRIEPSGAVKGWAIEQAAELLRACDVRDFCVNIGGDLYASGEFNPGVPWRIGLQHPFDRMKVMATLAVSDMAVATSGLYERGDHIVSSARSGDDLPDLVSMTLVGTDITLTDAYATAAFAMGVPGMEWAADLPGFDVFAVDSRNLTHHSAGIDRILVS